MRYLFLALAFALCACSPDPSATQRPPSSAATHPATVELHKALVANTNYDRHQLALDVQSAQVVVAVTNSNLLQASHPDRDADAARIAHVLESEITAKPELRGVQAIHVDYYASEGGSAPSLKDSMDFRRDAAGKFKRDVS